MREKEMTKITKNRTKNSSIRTTLNSLENAVFGNKTLGNSVAHFSQNRLCCSLHYAYKFSRRGSSSTIGRSLIEPIIRTVFTLILNRNVLYISVHIVILNTRNVCTLILNPSAIYIQGQRKQVLRTPLSDLTR